MRLVGRIRTLLAAEVGVRVVFEAPTPAGLAARLEGAGAARPALAARVRPGVVPLSFAQQRLWFLAQLEGPSATYNNPVALRLGGVLEVAALEAALGDVIGRHEVLRTVFPAAGGQPCQQVLDLAGLGWRLPVTGVAEADLAAAVAEASGQPFDLETQIPVRARLLRLGPDDHVLVVVIHHIAGDGWSMGILARDVSAAYAARMAGREPGWAPLPVQYADYALWQRELLGDPGDPASMMAQQAGYWREVLAGAPAELALPASRPRPPVPSYRGHSAGLDIPAGLHEQLTGLAREHGVTLHMVVQGALAVLLARLGAGTDIPVGSPVAGRTDTALDELVGFFVNTLVLRTDVSGDPAFATLLGRVREAALGALDHQDVPFERLVEDLAPDRSLARHPLTQVSLVLQNQAPAGLELAGLNAVPLPASLRTARFDLVLVAAETFDGEHRPAGMTGTVTVAADLFDPDAAGALAARLTRVLAAVAAEPGVRVHRVDILDPAERDFLAAQRGEDAGPGRTLPELVAAQTARTPDTVAVASAGECLSYAELSSQASRLGQALTGLGAGPETVAAILLERSAALVIAQLAVTGSGAAWLPLDPGYPPERTGQLMRDARPALVIASAVTARLLPQGGPPVLLAGPPGPARPGPVRPAGQASPPRCGWTTPPT